MQKFTALLPETMELVLQTYAVSFKKYPGLAKK